MNDQYIFFNTEIIEILLFNSVRFLLKFIEKIKRAEKLYKINNSPISIFITKNTIYERAPILENWNIDIIFDQNESIDSENKINNNTAGNNDGNANDGTGINNGTKIKKNNENTETGNNEIK
jgi:hypothetical protein